MSNDFYAWYYFVRKYERFFNWPRGPRTGGRVEKKNSIQIIPLKLAS